MGTGTLICNGIFLLSPLLLSGTAEKEGRSVDL